MMIKKIFLAVLAVMMSSAFVSCIDSADDTGNTASLEAYFTIQHSANNLTLWMDGGAIVYPTAASAAALMKTEGFSTIKRAVLTIQYDKNTLTTNSDGAYIIKDADVPSGQGIVTSNMIELTKAQHQNVFANDSVYAFDNSIDNETNVWFYKGFMTVRYMSSFYVHDKTYIMPTITAVYKKSESDPSTIDVELVLNKHKVVSTDVLAGTSYFVNCFDLTSLQHEIMGMTGKVKMNFSYKGVGSTKTFKYEIDKDHFFLPY